MNRAKGIILYLIVIFMIMPSNVWALSADKTWQDGEVLTADDLNNEFTNNREEIEVNRDKIGGADVFGYGTEGHDHEGSGEGVNLLIDAMADDNWGFFTITSHVAAMNDASIDGDAIANDAVDPNKMADGDYGAFTITSNVSAMDANTVSSATIIDNTITTSDILNSTITLNDLADALQGCIPNLYVDTNGTSAWLSADTEEYTASESFIELKEFTLNKSPSSLKIYFEMYTNDADSIAHGRIYRNDVAVGTEQTTTSLTYVAFTETIAGWSAGDTCELYCYIGHSDDRVYVKNFRIIGTISSYVSNE